MNGLIGSGLTLLVGFYELGMGLDETLLSILASNVAAVIALLVTLRTQRLSWVVKQVHFRTLKTWTFTLAVFLGIAVSLSPPLRDVHRLLILALPLALSTGFGIIVFGPIQDSFVRADQRRASRRSS